MARIDEAKQLLLISNSTLHGSGYLDHAEKAIRDLVGDRTSVIFIPYALRERRAYAVKAQERFREMGLSLTSIHDVSNKPRAIDEADVIFVGGGIAQPGLLPALWAALLEPVEALRHE